jgi:hypothetical protein
MNRLVSFYHRETGALHDARLMTSDPASIKLNTPADHVAIDGHHDRLCKRVDIDTGEVVDYQPPAPSVDHEWNADARRWRLSPAATARIEARAASVARIAALVNSQHQFVREHLLGVTTALERLAAINDEVVRLSADL